MSNEKLSLKWIECDGGPHIILEKRLANSWLATNCESHYDKACEIDDYIGMIPLNDGYGVVISEDIAKSTWVETEDKKCGYVVVLNYIAEGISDDIIANKVLDIEDELFEPTDLKFNVQDKSLYLFAACDSGPNWMYDFLEIQLEPGTYAIDTIEDFEFDECSLRIHRFRKV